MCALARLADEQLTKRAAWTWRITLAVSILGSAGAFCYLSRLVLSGPAPASRSVLISLVALATAAGYGALVVAAKRGSWNALLAAGLSAGATIHCWVVPIWTVSAATASLQFGRFPLPAIFVSLILVLNYYGRVLAQLRSRGLWESTFGPERPNRRLCYVGGVLLAAALYGGKESLDSFAVAAQEWAQSQTFLSLINSHEPGLMDGVRSLAKPNGAQRYTVSEKLEILSDKMNELGSALHGKGPLRPIVSKYQLALFAWKQGIAALEGDERDLHKAEKLFREGDKLRLGALKEFNRSCYPKVRIEEIGTKE